MRFKTPAQFKAGAERLIRRQAPDAVIVWTEVRRNRYIRKGDRNMTEVDGFRGFAEFAAPGYRPKRVLARYDFAADIDELEVR